MSYETYRKRAEDLVKEVGIQHPPVDVERVARHCKLPVVYAELGSETSGLLVVESSSSARICINKEDAPTRRRFSAAHEIGHWVLSHHMQPGVHVDRGHIILPRDPRSSQGVDRTEIQANQFAYALLMPQHMVEAAVEKLVAQRTPRLLKDSDVTDLAELFQVSEQAMTIRLSKLRML